MEIGNRKCGQDFAQNAAQAEMRRLLIVMLFTNISMDDLGPAHGDLVHKLRMDFKFHLSFGPVPQQSTI